MGAIALSYPPPSLPLPIAIDDSSWKNAAESFTIDLTLTLGGGGGGGCESGITPIKVEAQHNWS